MAKKIDETEEGIGAGTLALVAIPVLAIGALWLWPRGKERLAAGKERIAVALETRKEMKGQRTATQDRVTRRRRKKQLSDRKAELVAQLQQIETQLAAA